MSPELEAHLRLCKRVYLRMEREGSWPWKQEPDSTLPEDLIESEDNQSHV
jgi:hypothetical protein